ncbi:MAG TPA: patatin-like phospholipase family protein [Solirubrobacteraceae bacterium]|jgi:NTE family protein|nr:patatin-like phospholipase family protein [Solirubrobacteraceae bacterium]
MPTATLPDILVLGAGGILGEAWMSGVLAGLEDAAGLDLREVETFVGTSAGSIVAAHLAGGGRPRRPRGGEAGGDPGFVEDAPPRAAGAGERLRDLVRVAAMPLAPVTLALGAAGGALPRRLALAALPDGTRRLDHLRAEVRRSGVRFDGRLRVCCVDRGSGRRVVFGAPGAPPAEVADAVAASCSIPAVFRPVAIDGRAYVDGGAWSLTNLDAAPAGRGSDLLCLHPSARGGAAITSPWGALRTAAATASELEALALRARGARVRIVGPSREAGAAMGANLMDPGPAVRVHALGYRQGRGLA